MSRAWVWFSVVGAAVAAAVLVLQVVVPLNQGLVGFVWPGDYYLAMGHSVNPDVPYPFFWSPQWQYQLGMLTPLIAVGGFVALVVGSQALRAGTRVAAIPTVVGACELLAFLGGFAVSAVWFGHGIPV
jgi:hypothetical protein